jgi:hypothetical protein
METLTVANERNEVERAPRMGGAPTALPAGREGRVPFPIFVKCVIAFLHCEALTCLRCAVRAGRRLWHETKTHP